MRDKRLALAVLILLRVASEARSQDWPQWRGPLGQGTSSATNLPPAGSSSLNVLWKTAIPGEGCSSPIVSQGRVYVTTAYEGSEANAWDRPALGAILILACCSVGLALMQLPRVWRSLSSRSVLRSVLLVWTAAVVFLVTVVLAKPRWFWQFADPWTGTTIAAAALPWVEALNLRPVIVLVCGSLVLLYIAVSGKVEGGSFVSAFILPISSFSMAFVACRPEWFFQASQPWLAWVVTGGLGLFAIAGSFGWLEVGAIVRRLLVGAGFVLAAWLFHDTPSDEFGHPLRLQNRITYLIPALVVLFFHLFADSDAVRLARSGREKTQKSQTMRGQRLRFWCSFVAILSTLLPAIVFVRANYLQPQAGVVRAVVCLDARSGEVLWNTPVYVAATEKRHSLNSLATPTPACDGERVYAYFGSGLAALDKNGQLLWLKRDADFAGFIRYGAGSSVALAGDRIIIYRDSEFVGHGNHLDDDIQNQPQRRPSALTAYDKMTGAEVWRVAPTFSHDSYMTPLVWTRDDRLEVVIATWKTLAGFAVSDGALRWSHPHPMQQIVPSLAVNGDNLIVSGGNTLPAPMMAVQAPSLALQRRAQTLWFNRLAGGNIVSPVCWEGLVFSMSHADVLTCRDAESGSIHWRARLESRCLASLVAGDGKLFALDSEGTLYVYAADTTGSLLASHSFLESCSATPALAEGSIFVRTVGHIYRLGRGVTVLRSS